MKQVGIAGGYSTDHIVRVGAGARFRQPGGPGTYAALAAALVDGVRVSLGGELPLDDVGEVRPILAGAGVDTSRCRLVSEASSLWILDAPEGRRIVPTAVAAGEPELVDGSPDREQPREDATAADYADRLTGCDALLVSNPAIRNVMRIPPAPIVGVDPEQLELRDHGWSYLEACAGYAGVLLPSRLQLCQLGADPLRVAREIRHRFAVVVVAKLDRDGVVVCGRDGQTWRIVDHEVRVIDTTGAGDALAGATIAALATGADPPTAAAIGVSAARLALSDWGVGGLRSFPPGTLARTFPGVEVTNIS